MINEPLSILVAFYLASLWRQWVVVQAMFFSCNGLLMLQSVISVSRCPWENERSRCCVGSGAIGIFCSPTGLWELFNSIAKAQLNPLPWSTVLWLEGGRTIVPKNSSKFIGKRHHVGSLLKRVDEKVIHLISNKQVSLSMCRRKQACKFRSHDGQV